MGQYFEFKEPPKGEYITEFASAPEEDLTEAIGEIDGGGSEAEAERDDGPDPKKLDQIFELEKQDPKHRMGNYLFLLKEEWEKKPPEVRSKQPFFSYVDGLSVMEFKRVLGAGITQFAKDGMGTWQQRLADFQAGVKYKPESQRGKYLIKFDGGTLKRLGKFTPEGRWISTGTVEPYSTTGFRSHWSGDGWAIWVESKNKEFYSNRMKVGKFQHSTFLSGKAVRAAGEWKVEGGRIRKISGRSGHYKPTLEHLVQALKDLQEKGVVLRDVDVILYEAVFGRGDERVVKAGDLIAMRNPRTLYKIDPTALP